MRAEQLNTWLLGATGFIGQALFTRLAAHPDNRLHLLLHRHTPFRLYENHHTIMGSMAGFDFSWFNRFPPAVIYHMARMAGSRLITRTMASYMGERANRHWVTELGKLPHPPAVVYGSGSLVYGSMKEGCTADEHGTIKPAAFARHYHVNEKPWQQAADQALLDVRFARPAWIVGPASWFKTFFWDHYMKTGSVPVYGHGQQWMSLIHIRDCAMMIDRLGKSKTPIKTLNIFSAPPITQQDFAEQLASLLKASVAFVSLTETRRQYGDTTASALTASIPLSSIHKDFYSGIRFAFPTPGDILSDVVGLLKNK